MQSDMPTQEDVNLAKQEGFLSCWRKVRKQIMDYEGEDVGELVGRIEQVITRYIKKHYYQGK